MTDDELRSVLSQLAVGEHGSPSQYRLYVYPATKVIVLINAFNKCLVWSKATGWSYGERWKT